MKSHALIVKDRYRAMVKRFGEKKNKKGAVIRQARLVPFTLDEFMVWFRYRLGGDLQCHTDCVYCARTLTITTLRVDHDIPVDRGGSLGLSNLLECCDDCNRIKGSLTGEEYVALLRGLKTFPEAARKDITRRLKMGSGFQRLRYFNRKEKPLDATPL
jgi:5-methylcytosine-specific restriction endonuclease McrA